MTKWHVERAEGTKIKDEGGNTVLWTQHTHLRGRRTDEEVMQIARLAAAAPELLAALKVAQLWLDVDGRFDMQAINAAIAKAEGR